MWNKTNEIQIVQDKLVKGLSFLKKLYLNLPKGNNVKELQPTTEI